MDQISAVAQLFRTAATVIVQLSNCEKALDVCPNDGITFWIYNKNNLNTGLQVTFDSLSPNLFDLTKPLVFLIHGFSTNRNDPLNTNNRELLINNVGVNVISLDYGKLVPYPCYLQSVQSVGIIGRCVGKFLDKLIQLNIFKKENIHLLAFSLGSHVAGVAGSTMTRGPVARITGLDPASPIIGLYSETNRLDKTDATFVDIIHTDIRTRGMQDPIGHIDFYPNGGDMQAGCETAKDPGDCNHERVTRLFAESITTKIGFWGTPCTVQKNFWLQLICKPKSDSTKSDKVLMGYYVPKTATGTYYLKTNSVPPYAQGK